MTMFCRDLQERELAERSMLIEPKDSPLMLRSNGHISRPSYSHGLMVHWYTGNCTHTTVKKTGRPVVVYVMNCNIFELTWL